MIFLSALLFALLLFVIPGELLLMWAASRTGEPGLERWMHLTLMNVGVFLLLFAAVRFTRLVVNDLGWEHGHLTHRLSEWLDVTGWRWVNVLGLLGVGGGAVILALEGRLPLPFWFLFAAIVVGLSDLMRKRAIVPLPKTPPQPRFVPEPEPPPAAPGKTATFAWEFYRPGPPPSVEGKSAQLILDDAEYQAARQKARFPNRPVSEYLKYVRQGFSPSVQRVASYLRAETAKEDYSPLEELMNVVGFTRGITYKGDEETHAVIDYASFPIETLYDLAGDCEDHAILAAALLHNLGHDVALFHLDFGPCGHLALGYRPSGSGVLPPGPFCGRADDGREYYYVETVPTETSEGLGEISQQFLQGMQQHSVIAVT